MRIFPTTRDYNIIYDNVNASPSGVMNTLYAAPGDTVRLRILNARNGDFSGMQIEAAFSVCRLELLLWTGMILMIRNTYKIS